MANPLANTQACVDFFQQHTITRLHDWRDHAAVAAVDVSTLDGEHARILKAILLGLSIDTAWPSVRDLVIAFAPYMERRGHWEAWHVALQRAIGAAQRVGDADGEIILTVLLAKLCQRQSRAQDVVRYYRRVIRLARQRGNRYEMARACSNLGYFYIDDGHWWRSDVLSQKALAIFEELASTHGQAHTHNHLGLLYTRLHRWHRAEYHLNQACNLWASLDDRHSMIYGFVNLGLYSLEQNSATSAIEYLTQAQEYARITGEVSITGTILNSMASAHRLKKDIQHAEMYAQQAETIHHQFHNTLGLAQVWNNLGLIYLLKGDQKRTIHFFNRSLQTYRQLRHKVGEVQVLLDMTGFHLGRHEFNRAAQSLSLLTALLAQNKDRVIEGYRSRIEEYHHRLSRNTSDGDMARLSASRKLAP